MPWCGLPEADLMQLWPLPQVLAHRCGGALAPENTLAGLDVAVRHGCRGVEFDVMLSADGFPLLIHDETLARTTSGHGEVSHHTLAQLRRLDAGSWFDPRFAAERLPTLDEALARCAELGLAVNLEIKPATGFERQTGRTVAEYLARGSANGVPGLVVSSFSEAAIAEAMTVLPDAIYGLLVEDLPADWAGRAERLGVHAIHACASSLNATQARAVRDGGYHLAVYTENDSERAKALLRLGVETVITDFPDQVRAADMFLA
jgi:glycerophosphoryl diester phosphodiesterase